MVTLIELGDDCPHIRTYLGIASTGEVYGEYDYCKLTERPSGRMKPCVLKSGETCEIWEEIKREWVEEK